jgi:hypothetical protein
MDKKERTNYIINHIIDLINENSTTKNIYEFRNEMLIKYSISYQTYYHILRGNNIRMSQIKKKNSSKTYEYRKYYNDLWRKTHNYGQQKQINKS